MSINEIMSDKIKKALRNEIPQMQTLRIALTSRNPIFRFPGFFFCAFDEKGSDNSSLENPS